MKLAEILDANATALASDPKNQLILKELIVSEYSVTELANRLNFPMVTLWKRMQKLLAAGMIEVSDVRKSGNLERKMYRSAAARFVPAELLDFKPKDKRLIDAFETYSRLQRVGMALLSRMNEIPEGTDPVDYGIYATMNSFVQVCKMPDFQLNVTKLESELAKYGRDYQSRGPAKTPTGGRRD